MQTVLLVIHVMLALAMIVTVLLQRSEGGALGIGGGGGGAGGGLMTGRGAANLLTRTTAFLAAGFFATSITLAILAGGDRAPTSVIDSAPAQQAPVAPTGPVVPKQ
jgi:preprotein translocase subunit SecG